MGAGNFATVFLVKERKTGKDYAAKVISRKRVEGKEHLVLNELRILTMAQHPNIVFFVELVETTANINVIMELATGGDLFERVRRGRVPEKEVKGYIRQLLRGLLYLHSMNIVHRDVKPENVLLYDLIENRVLLIDFGLATQIVDGVPLKESLGSPEYVAPEVLRPPHAGYGTKADMWSVGVLTYILLGGYHPFTAESKDTRNMLIRTANFEFHEDKWNHISKEAKQFIKKLITVNTNERIDCPTALDHPWIALTLEELELELKAEADGMKRRELQVIEREKWGEEQWNPKNDTPLSRVTRSATVAAIVLGSSQSSEEMVSATRLRSSSTPLIFPVQSDEKWIEEVESSGSKSPSEDMFVLLNALESENEN